jgi:hypothetical protein
MIQPMIPASRFFLAALSAGWLLPSYLAFRAFSSFLSTELEPLIMGKPVVNSFGELYLCRIWLAIAAGWLAAAIVYWVEFVIRRERGRKEVTH